MRIVKIYSKYIFVLAVFVFGTFFGIFISKYTSYQMTKNVSTTTTSNLLNQQLPAEWKGKESEPGNSFATSLNLTTGYATQGSLNPGNVVDFYNFNLNQPSDILISVTNVPSDFGFELFDSNFNEIAHTLRFGSVEGSSKIHLQSTGKYYLKVLANYTQISNIAYTVRLSILPFNGD